MAKEQFTKIAEAGKASEIEQIKSRYAFSGFGRSTTQVDKSTETEKKAQERVMSAMGLDNAEDNYQNLVDRGYVELAREHAGDKKNPWADALSDAQEAIKYAQNNYSKKTEEQTKRKAEVSKSITNLVQALTDKMRYNNQMRKTFKASSIRNKQINVPIRTAKPITSKNLEKGLKKSSLRTKTLSDIISSNRSKNLGGITK